MFNGVRKTGKKTFTYIFDKVNLEKIEVRFNTGKLYAGIPFPEFKKKVEDAAKNIDLDKTPEDANGIRILEVEGQIVPVGQEKKIEEIVNTTIESLDNYILKLSNKNIREAIIHTIESRNIAQKYYNKIKNSPNEYIDGYKKNLDNFDKWYEEVFKSNLFEAHHIIPKQILENTNLRKILDWARKNNKSWDFGGIDNGIMLQKRKKNIAGEMVGDHANHPNYNNYIDQKIDNIVLNNKGDLEASFDDFLEFTQDLKKRINIEVIKGDNELISTFSFV